MIEAVLEKLCVENIAEIIASANPEVKLIEYFRIALVTAISEKEQEK